MNNIFYVYIWIRKDINKVFYVGKGHGNRYRNLKTSRNRWFKHVVEKVGKDNLEVKIIESELEEKTAFEREKYYIKYFKEIGHPLTNLTSGGDGSSDWFQYLTEEEKEKHREISKSFLGKNTPKKRKGK